MMDKDILIRIIKVERELHTQLCKMYWDRPDNSHCGSEYDEEMCFDCRHVAQCASSHAIYDAVKYVMDRV